MRKFSIHALHRWVGVTIALLVLILTLTGLLLNHTDALKLNQRQIAAPWLLNWYGITLPDTFISFPAHTHYITQMGHQLFFDAQPLALSPQPDSFTETALHIKGVIAHADFIAIALTQQILLLNSAGQLLESIPLPFPLEKIGLSESLPAQPIALSTEQGHYYQTDTNWLTWQTLPDQNPIPAIIWSQTTALPPELHNLLTQHYLGEGLPWERVILDIHSGRFWGAWGIWLVDLAALLFCWLALSGLWLWGNRAYHQRQRRRQIAASITQSTD